MAIRGRIIDGTKRVVMCENNYCRWNVIRTNRYERKRRNEDEKRVSMLYQKGNVFVWVSNEIGSVAKL